MLTGEPNGGTAAVPVEMSPEEAARRSELLRLAQRLPEVSVAFLQLSDPSLSREFTRPADLGATRIAPIGVSFGRLAPARSWLRRIFCGLTDDVLVTRTGRQSPRNHAPVVSVQPDDVRYGGVDAEAAREIVAGHLRDGRPLNRHRLERSPLAPRDRGES